MLSTPRLRNLSKRASSLTAFLAVIAFAAPAGAQAWIPPAGSGSVTFLVQKIDNTGHFLADGSKLGDGKSTNVSAYVEADYAVTDRVAISAGLPYVFAKYVGPGETPIRFLPVDQCRCWHGGWQDASLTLRYNMLNGAFGLTPSMSFGMPVREYDYRGEAVVGRGLRELRIGIDGGRRLDEISSRLAVQARYAYAVVERVLDVPNNRSNTAIEANYAASGRLSTWAFASWQRTHGGLRFPFDITTDERLDQHDRLLRDNSFHAGVGAVYSWAKLDMFGSYVAYVSGTDSHAGRIVTVGVSWPFELRSIP